MVIIFEFNSVFHIKLHTLEFKKKKKIKNRVALKPKKKTRIQFRPFLKKKKKRIPKVEFQEFHLF